MLTFRRLQYRIPASTLNVLPGDYHHAEAFHIPSSIELLPGVATSPAVPLHSTLMNPPVWSVRTDCSRWRFWVVQSVQ